MQKYKILTKAMIVGYVEATSEKEAVEKYCGSNLALGCQVRAVLDSNIAPILKTYRESNNMTRKELAGKLGIARMSLYRLERHKHKPSRATLQSMRTAGII